MSVLKMAWRNVWRNKRRSGVTIAAMTLALIIEVLYSGLVSGFLQGMEKDLLDLEVGDLQIFAAGYLDKPSIYAAIGEPGKLIGELEKIGYPACPRLLGGALAAAGESSAGVALRGIEPGLESRVTRMAEAVGEGKWLDPSSPAGVVVGRRLARTLGVTPGDEIVLLGQAADGTLAHDLFEIRGILLGISDGTDRTAVFMHAGTFRRFMEIPEGAHQIIVRRPEDSELETVAGEIRRLAPGLDVRTWKELMPLVASMFESSKGMIAIIFLVIYLGVAILVLNAMLMAVFERVREFGILKAIGVGPGSVFSLILIESGIQALLAIGIGLAMSCPGMWYLARHGIDMGKLGGMNMMGLAMQPIWSGVYTWESILAPVLLLVLVVFLAALYPALKAALIRPVAAMHHR